MIFRYMSLAFIFGILFGCASPVVKGDSAQVRKLASFPKVGAKSTALVGSLAVLYANYTSNHIYKLAKPLTLSVMLINKVVVSTEERLLQSDIDGETVYCSQNNTFVDALVGPTARSCFKSTTPGKFSSVTYRPGAIWLTKDLSPEAEYLTEEIQAYSQSSPMKRELIYEGNENGTLMFSERIYENSLTTPSRVKPIISKIQSLPARINLDGMEINVVRIEEKTFTFELVTPWQ